MARHSIQLSDIYTPITDHASINSPACLSTITESKPPGLAKTLLNVESEIEYSKNFNKKLVLKTKKKINKEFYEIASEASDEMAGSSEGESTKLAVMSDKDIKVYGKVEFPESKSTFLSNRSSNNNNEENLNVSDDNNNSSNVQNETKFSTLPMMRSRQKGSLAIPQRTTPDGTKIFYICDLPKKIRKGFL